MMDIEGQDIAVKMDVKVEQNPATRAQFLVKYPIQTEWVDQMEGHFGPFLTTSSLGLDGGRVVMAIRFERGWHWLFINPENGEDKYLHVNLTREAMCAFVGLFEFVATEEQRVDDWKRLIESLKKAEAEGKEGEEATGDDHQ